MTGTTDLEGAFRPGTPEGARAFVLSPFARMARAHAVGAMGDAMVAASLAGSLFFSVPDGDARGPVLQYLVITMLPFSVMSPLIGPMIDRMKGGHRLMVIGSMIVRGIACWLMASAANDGSWAFFLYALILLVFQKAYQVARSALIPTLVQHQDGLVQANSKLALISGIASVIGVIPAALVMQLTGPEWSLRLAMIVYGVGTLMSTRIPAARVAEEAADPTEKMELRGATIFMAGSAMGIIRGLVGFMMFLIAFTFNDDGKPTIAMALVGGSLAACQQIGNLIAPRIRRFTNEENLLTGVLLGVVGGGLASFLLSDVTGGMLVGATVGFAASAGKLAFDSILQRDAPDANRGRAFARFETKFQIFWVGGALIPVAFHLDAFTGYVIVMFVALFAVATYVMTRMSYAHQTGARQTIGTARAAALDARIEVVSSEVKGRLASMPRVAFRRLRAGRADEAFDDDSYDDDHDDWYGEDGDYGYGDDDGYSEDGYDDGRGGDRRGDPVEGDDGRYGNDPDRWEQPRWADGDDVSDLAAGSHVAWRPDEPEEFPWEPPVEPRGGDLLDGIDADLDNPYPWSPDDPTRPN